MIMLVTLAAVTGFLVGLLTFKIKQHWCPKCGRTLGCLNCKRVPYVTIQPGGHR